jgi:hypothetical protein
LGLRCLLRAPLLALSLFAFVFLHSISFHERKDKPLREQSKWPPTHSSTLNFFSLTQKEMELNE